MLSEIGLSDLPSLPKRNHSVRFSECSSGVCLILSLTGFLVFMPMLFPPQGTSRFDLPRLSFNLIGLLLLYFLAVLAVACLCAILVCDPGSIKRSKETCFPLPREVEARLRAKQSLEGLRNLQPDRALIRSGLVTEDQTYCVRCCVWRPSGSRDDLGAPGDMRCHHCSVCQRCVMYFDHHCGVRQLESRTHTCLKTALARVLTYTATASNLNIR